MRARWFWIPVAMVVVAATACFLPENGPVIDDFRCPVDGSRYTNNYGPRGSGFHFGIDMIAPTGRTLWAVKSGNVQYALESAGGLVAYLFADGGTVYYYAHMSDTVGGGNRRVAQGDAIGRVGQTGNATGPHLHFEMRLGGVLEKGTNPFNTLRAAGC
jgi:murein DD-endopeptidase MepM/ murein hydrolase activator NlpD